MLQVNSIAWNESGEFLLSGADDCHLNIYRPANRKVCQQESSDNFCDCTGGHFIINHCLCLAGNQTFTCVMYFFKIYF